MQNPKTFITTIIHIIFHSMGYTVFFEFTPTLRPAFIDESWIEWLYIFFQACENFRRKRFHFFVRFWTASRKKRKRHNPVAIHIHTTRSLCFTQTRHDPQVDVYDRNLFKKSMRTLNTYFCWHGNLFASFLLIQINYLATVIAHAFADSLSQIEWKKLNAEWERRGGGVCVCDR